MSVVVGTNSYISVSEADSYFSARNNSTWSTADNADKEKALIESVQYMDNRFNYIGTQIETNPLAWPRYYAIISDGNFKGVSYDASTVPQCVKDAQAELALDALSQSLNPTLDRGGAIKREKVDTLEIEYSDFAPTNRSYNFAAMILSRVIAGNSTNRKVVR